MKDDSDYVNGIILAVGWSVVISLFIGFFIGSSYGAKLSKSKFQKRAIEAGVAQYHPNTSEFEFIEPDNKK